MAHYFLFGLLIYLSLFLRKLFCWQGQRIALFPDTVSIRAQRHLRELTAIARKGASKASVVFLVQRGDCSAFAPCWEKDPTYASLLMTAVADGVTAVAIACELDVESERVIFKDNLPVKLDYKAR
jgi:sugar fermentation stimulation protein A